MSWRRRAVVAVAALAGYAWLFLGAPGTAHAETISGRIVGVTDGDTVTLLVAERQQVKIRLAGIDAPERRQAFGDRAKTELSRIAFGRDAEADCSKHKHRDRRICVVTVGGADVGLEQVRNGMAWYYRQYERELRRPGQREEYSQAEFGAKVRRLGLWNDKNPVPPWEFRHPGDR